MRKHFIFGGFGTDKDLGQSSPQQDNPATRQNKVHKGTTSSGEPLPESVTHDAGRSEPAPQEEVPAPAPAPQEEAETLHSIPEQENAPAPLQEGDAIPLAPEMGGTPAPEAPTEPAQETAEGGGTPAPLQGE